MTVRDLFPSNAPATSSFKERPLRSFGEERLWEALRGSERLTVKTLSENFPLKSGSKEEPFSKGAKSERSRFPVPERRKNKKRKEFYEMVRVAGQRVATTGIRNQRFATKLLSLPVSLFRLLVSIIDRPNESSPSLYTPDGCWTGRPSGSNGYCWPALQKQLILLLWPKRERERERERENRLSERISLFPIWSI